MASKSLFAQVIEWNGSRWYLQYDPADTMSVMPDLTGARILNVGCSEVKLPGQSEDKPFYLAVVDVEFPATMYGNEVRPERLLKGFRLYDYMPPDPTNIHSLRLQEMAYYLKEPAVVSNQQSAQDFLNCALGGIIADAERQQATDREWSRTLLEPLTRASEPQDATEAQQKKPTPTPQPAGQPGSDTKA